MEFERIGPAMVVGRLSTVLGISRATISLVALAVIGAVVAGAAVLLVGYAALRHRRKDPGEMEVEVVSSQTLNRRAESDDATKQGDSHRQKSG